MPSSESEMRNCDEDFDGLGNVCDNVCTGEPLVSEVPVPIRLSSLPQVNKGL